MDRDLEHMLVMDSSLVVQVGLTPVLYYRLMRCSTSSLPWSWASTCLTTSQPVLPSVQLMPTNSSPSAPPIHTNEHVWLLGVQCQR